MLWGSDLSPPLTICHFIRDGLLFYHMPIMIILSRKPSREKWGGGAVTRIWCTDGVCRVGGRTGGVSVLLLDMFKLRNQILSNFICPLRRLCHIFWWFRLHSGSGLSSPSSNETLSLFLAASGGYSSGITLQSCRCQPAFKLQSFHWSAEESPRLILQLPPYISPKIFLLRGVEMTSPCTSWVLMII